jgi:hypothetical protein
MQLLLLINDNYDKYTEKHKKKLSLPIWIRSVFMELVLTKNCKCTKLKSNVKYVKSYPAKRSGTQCRQAQTRHSRQMLDKMEMEMEKTIYMILYDQRDGGGGGELLFHPLRSLDYYWLINIYFLLRNLFSNQ